MEYHLGQLVACTDDNLEYTGPGHRPDGMTLPRRGLVYRIRSRVFLRGRSDVQLLFLRFDEILNPTHPGPTGPYEPVFDARCFLPLDPRRLDIFRQQLAPVDQVPA